MPFLLAGQGVLFNRILHMYVKHHKSRCLTKQSSLMRRGYFLSFLHNKICEKAAKIWEKELFFAQEPSKGSSTRH